MTAFGETLARYRTEAGLNQRELGAAIGLDSTQLNKVERGHRPPLGAKYVKPLVLALRLKRSEAENLVDLAGLSLKVLDFMDNVTGGRAGESKQQAGAQPMTTMANLSVKRPNVLLGARAQEIQRLIALEGLEDEDEEQQVYDEIVEFTKRLLSFRRYIRHEREAGR
jgi:transcriptional regulator with XRE-family HTH domain